MPRPKEFTVTLELASISTVSQWGMMVGSASLPVGDWGILGPTGAPGVAPVLWPGVLRGGRAGCSSRNCERVRGAW